MHRTNKCWLSSDNCLSNTMNDIFELENYLVNQYIALKPTHNLLLLLHTHKEEAICCKKTMYPGTTFIIVTVHLNGLQFST